MIGLTRRGLFRGPVGHGADVSQLYILNKSWSKRKAGPLRRKVLTGSGHVDAAEFHADFVWIIAWLWNTYFSSAQTSKKHVWESAHESAQAKSAQKIGSVFGRTDFFADFYFWAAGFFLRILSPDFSPHSFLWEKRAQKILPEKSLAKSSKIYAKTNPDTFLQRGRVNKNRSKNSVR